QYIKVCDGGMGMHRLGPLETRVSDPLGVFQFRVINEDIIEMETLPKVEALPAIEIGGSPFSTEYGNYTLGQRGLSVNFSSVRPYSPGDSLRHIAWRLSARRGDLLVKEFERAINSQITLVLDLNPNIHLGIKSQSTWEYARDVALAVIAQQLELNNSVRLISNHYFSEMKKGEDHLHHLCIEVSKWHPDIFANSPDLMKWGTGSELLSRTSQLLSPGSTLIYLCPYHQSDFGQSREVLKSFLGEKIHLVVIFIDVNTFVKPLVRKMDWAQLAEVASCRGLKQEMSLLSKFEISSYRVAWGDPIGRGFIGHFKKRKKTKAQE
ncbi:MAG: DUF58 domain-containing protein, partial [Bdellovibrionales bacterium]|nr:DUF58 domain-containing protein [Bdellovibrionales bacterium]